MVLAELMLLLLMIIDLDLLDLSLPSLEVLLFSLLLSLFVDVIWRVFSWFDVVLRIDPLRIKAFLGMFEVELEVVLEFELFEFEFEPWARGSDPARLFRSTATGSIHFRSYELKDWDEVVFGKGKAEGRMAAFTDILSWFFHEFFFTKKLIISSFFREIYLFFFCECVCENKWTHADCYQ